MAENRRDNYSNARGRSNWHKPGRGGRSNGQHWNDANASADKDHYHQYSEPTRRDEEFYNQHQGSKKQKISPDRDQTHRTSDDEMRRISKETFEEEIVKFRRSLKDEMSEFKDKISTEVKNDVQHLKDEMHTMTTTISAEKEKDLQYWKDEMSEFKDKISTEVKNDVQHLEKEIREMRENFSAEKEKDRQCLIAQGNKMAHSDITNINYGTASHEIQISHGGEAKFNDYYKSCKKNPGHKQLVHIHEFETVHLPEGIKNPDIVEFIKATADLTVRVDVKMTSMKRPAFWPKTKDPYGFNNIKGKSDQRTGSGLLCVVEKWTENQNKGTCKCRKCLQSKYPSNVWGVVSMLTASELVFDEQEAKYTTCTLFYNREDSPVAALAGWKVDNFNIEQGWVVLNCMTCDLPVLDKLEKIWKHWRFNLLYKVNNKYKSSRDKHKFIFIVSHPHGGPKKVSVGHWTNKREVSQGWFKYTYTTCTCPGSSGAYVHLMGYNDWNRIGGIVHSGVDTNGKNVSCTGANFDFD